jgi:vitamin B12 transporter
MKMRYPSWTASMAAIFAITPLHADEVDTLVVTATRQPAKVSALMADVTVIDREEIERAGQSSLEELLSRQPGIQHTANGGLGTISGIFIRGASPNQSLVLIDGQRVSSATTGDVALWRIPLSQIDRIEILRGPASSLYGADAIGGVIQIFTRQGTGSVQLDASASYGSNRTTDTLVGISGGTSAYSFSLQGGYAETSGFSAIRDKGNFFYNRDRDGYRNRNVSGNFALRPAVGHEIGASLFSSDGVNRYDSGPVGDEKGDQSLSSYSLYSKNRFSQNWTSMLRVGQSEDDLVLLADGQRTGKFRTVQKQASWQNDVALPIGTALVAAEYLKQSVSGTTEYTEDERTVKSILAGWSAAVDVHRVQVNLRHDDNSQFGGETTGSATYGYQIDSDWRAHLSYGTAFRAPSFNELYYPDTGFGGGNPDLKPEKSKNAEAGLVWEAGLHRVSAVYFHNKVTDLINNWPPENVNKATLEGVTLSYAGRSGAWSGGLSVDLQRPRNDEDGNRLARRADEQLFSYLSYATGPWTFGGEWQLVGERYDDAANRVRLGGYGLVNLFAECRIDREWMIFARGNNVFDKFYETVNDYGVPGAQAMIGVRYTPR